MDEHPLTWEVADPGEDLMGGHVADGQTHHFGRVEALGYRNKGFR
jgi:hypothetical protein